MDEDERKIIFQEKKQSSCIIWQARSLGIFDRRRKSTISRRWMAARSTFATSPPTERKRNQIARVGESMKQVLTPFFWNREPHAAAI